jgi:hypothetical protein
VNEYRTAEHRCNDELPSTVSLAPLERIAADNVQALTTWRDWATGQHVDADALIGVHRALTSARTLETRELAHTISHHLGAAERPQRRRPERAVDLSL